jgi:hypothetical protein
VVIGSCGDEAETLPCTCVRAHITTLYEEAVIAGLCFGSPV